MNQHDNTDQGRRVLDLVQKWRMQTLNDSENKELSTWFYALEGRELGGPIETTVNLVERRLHEQLYNKLSTSENNEQLNRHPWHYKNSNTEK
ncbi:hypothetical protein [Mucilaginibacter jinjuensis]|uniref:Uncharacterized protein n=1 Tax=Mucilaginibacter jinjuensis TaxID=1176721 RepID=A0ABY7TA43_9SPHI|nr:hypothetical protein [Mucilaginibacter jinjuensis]WCT13385.1 hypothetical protein PQO05_05485 [Mucilaginibacter jinjuensis]